MLSRSPFASASVSRHLARGGTGLLALAGGLARGPQFAVFLQLLALLHGGGPLGILAAVCAAGLAVVLLRGCPMCWVIGLVETVALRASHDRALITSKEGERP